VRLGRHRLDTLRPCFRLHSLEPPAGEVRAPRGGGGYLVSEAGDWLVIDLELATIDRELHPPLLLAAQPGELLGDGRTLMRE
jgi:hypothetical protein